MLVENIDTRHFAVGFFPANLSYRATVGWARIGRPPLAQRIGTTTAMFAAFLSVSLLTAVGACARSYS